MSPLTSAISISMPKAGSSIFDLIVADFYREKGFEIDRIATRVPTSPKAEPEIFKSYQDKMILNGVYYGVARGKYISEMAILDKMRLLIQVRDVRDCLVSAYFSFSKSHTPPNDPKKLAEFNARKEKLKKISIDQFALQNANDYRDRLYRLRCLVEAKKDLVVLTYEDMVLHTEDWLNQITEFVGQPITSNLRESLGQKTNFSMVKENPLNHKRQITPGDHVRKLRSSTVSEINTIIREEMEFFGYQI